MDDRPRIEEDHFDIEDHEAKSEEVVASVELSP